MVNSELVLIFPVLSMVENVLITASESDSMDILWKLWVWFSIFRSAYYMVSIPASKFVLYCPTGKSVSKDILTDFHSRDDILILWTFNHWFSFGHWSKSLFLILLIELIIWELLGEILLFFFLQTIFVFY